MAHPVSASVEASTQTKTEQHQVSTSNDKSTQTDKTPRPRTVQATTQIEPPTQNNEEKLEAQIVITKNTKKRDKEDIAQLGKLREQAAKREADLKRLLKERTTKIQAMEKEVADLQAANTEATRRLAKEEKTREQTVIQHFEETEPLRS